LTYHTDPTQAPPALPRKNARRKKNNMFDDIEFNIKEYPIKGQMVIGQVILKEIDLVMIPLGVDIKTHIKENLLKRLVNHMLENKLAEFTVTDDPVNASKLYRVRCFVTPDEQVRLIRKIYDSENSKTP